MEREAHGRTHDGEIEQVSGSKHGLRGRLKSRDRKRPARTQHARALGNRAIERRHVAQPVAGRDDVDRRVAKGRLVMSPTRNGICRAPGLRRASATMPRHEIERDHVRAARGGGERQIARAAREVEDARARRDRGEIERPALPGLIASVGEQPRDAGRSASRSCRRAARCSGAFASKACRRHRRSGLTRVSSGDRFGLVAQAVFTAIARVPAIR